MESVEHENQPKKVEAPFPLIDSSFLDEGIDSYKSLFEENLVEGLARQCNDLNGYNTCPLANVDAPCPFGSSKPCSGITADDWRKLELYVEEKESHCSVGQGDVKSEDTVTNFSEIIRHVVDDNLSGYKNILETEDFADSEYAAARCRCTGLEGEECPLRKEPVGCPFYKLCSKITSKNWENLALYVNSQRPQVEKKLSDVNSDIVSENVGSFAYVLSESAYDCNCLAEQCRANSKGNASHCPIRHIDCYCPFMTRCSDVSNSHWKELYELVLSTDKKVDTSEDGHKNSQESTVQEINMNETKEPIVRCYYAFMVKEEKIVFYKGVFTRRKTVPVAFTSESQRDLFVRNYECSYAVSRRQLLHELADAYQDRSITELSRVISEIRRRAISATENSNGAITYSDYLYFDMAEIVFDI